MSSSIPLADPNETAQDMVNVYRQECSAMRVRPITKLLEQLEVSSTHEAMSRPLFHVQTETTVLFVRRGWTI